MQFSKKVILFDQISGHLQRLNKKYVQTHERTTLLKDNLANANSNTFSQLIFHSHILDLILQLRFPSHILVSWKDRDVCKVCLTSNKTSLFGQHSLLVREKCFGKGNTERGRCFLFMFINFPIQSVCRLKCQSKTRLATGKSSSE